MAEKFIPDDFEIPSILKNDKILLKKLSLDDAPKDYEAIMSSVSHLKGIFGNDWPPVDLTLAEELMSLKLHQKDMDNRISFVYSVQNLEGSGCLGCVYFYPSPVPCYDAIVFLWVRQSEIANGLDKFLYSTVKKWVKDEWPFKNVAYPGRENPWDEFK